MSLFGKQGFSSTWVCGVWFMFIIYLKLSERVKGDPLVTDTTTYDEYEDYTEDFPIFANREILTAGPRVVGGVNAEIEEFPFMISIQYKRRHFCGGTLLTFKWILTCTHCFVKESLRKYLSALAGSTHVRELGEGAQRRTVVNIVMHGSYVEKGNLNDIGLVKVERDFNPSPVVSLVTLPIKKTKDLDPYEGMDVTCAGWGATAYKGAQSPILQKVDLKVLSYSSCQSRYRHQPKYMFFCAMESAKDACQGDSGGPLIYNGTQIGLVSYGIKCADKYPGVYTRIDSYLDWIISNAGRRSSAQGKLYLFAALGVDIITALIIVFKVTVI